MLLYSSVAIIRMVHAGRVLQNNLLVNVLRCPMSFFDTTPTGRIINRFSTDIEAIDSTIPHNLESFLDCMFIVLSTLVVITYSTPIFLSIIVPLGILYFFIQVKYSRLSISRTWISRILRNSKRLSDSKLHFDCFLQQLFGVGDFFTSSNYPKCKLICTSGNLNL